MNFVPNLRLAPTPSGFLHWGNLLNFTLTWAQARLNGGILHLRIDDMDAQRARPEYVEDIFQTLHFLGFDWDRGPRDAEDFYRHYSQASMLEKFRGYLQKLPHYECSCSRKELEARGSKIYDGFCRARGLKFEPLVTQTRFLAPEGEDFVLWRKENLPAYHLVSVAQDLEMGITHIVRGEDLRISSRQQLQLAMALGVEGDAFLATQFHHHRLLLDGQGLKLSKSQQAESLKDWRERGKSAAEIFEHLGLMAGWKGRSLGEFLKEFRGLEFQGPGEI